ncbi:GHKL domain-containing protein [Lachnospira hominis (ex Hitch et al. 2024)]
MIQYKIENSKRNMNLQKLVIKQRGQIQTVAYKSIIYIEGSNHLVKNSADKNRKKKIRSSEHGWGMKILDDIAQQYNGRLEYGFKDGIYSTMFSLVYTNNQEEGI